MVPAPLSNLPRPQGDPSAITAQASRLAALGDALSGAAQSCSALADIAPTWTGQGATAFRELVPKHTLPLTDAATAFLAAAGILNEVAAALQRAQELWDSAEKHLSAQTAAMSPFTPPLGTSPQDARAIQLADDAVAAYTMVIDRAAVELSALCKTDFKPPGPLSPWAALAIMVVGEFITMGADTPETIATGTLDFGGGALTGSAATSISAMARTFLVQGAAGMALNTGQSLIFNGGQNINPLDEAIAFVSAGAFNAAPGDLFPMATSTGEVTLGTRYALDNVTTNALQDLHDNGHVTAADILAGAILGHVGGGAETGIIIPGAKALAGAAERHVGTGVDEAFASGSTPWLEQPPGQRAAASGTRRTQPQQQPKAKAQ